MEIENLKVEFIQPESIRSIRGRTGDGMMAETYGCDVVWSDGSQQRAFLKCFPECRKLGVINEITGYLIARSCSLPVPDKAGVAKLSDEILASLNIEVCTRIYPYAFLVTESPGSSPNSLYPNLHNAAKAKLARHVLKGWPALCPLIAFDDWGANPDRNLGNFLIDGSGEIYIIDHSNMPVGVSWTPSELVVDKKYRNCLIDILTFDGAVPFEAAFVVRAAEGHLMAYNDAKDELSFWWRAFLGNDPKRCHAIEGFIRERASKGKDRISQHLLQMPV